MSKPENPPAFPVSSIDGFTQHGMDLRDWFAAMASEDDIGAFRHADNDFATPPRTNPEARYAFADAMLATRENSDA